MNRLVKTFALSAPLMLAGALTSNSADACGGCFVPPAENTVVSGHRMALSISPKQTVLWDQIQYQGNPEDFSWVLPIKPGARIEAADPAFFEALEAVTATQVSAPPLQCAQSGSFFGCGNGGSVALAAGGDFQNEGGGGVTVVKRETVGPYDSVTLSSTDPGALTAWLESHNYAIPDDIKPTIEDYVTEGFDFIALRLTPGNGVNLMSPVRVITAGASPVLPLRMVAAGTGAFTSVVLYVIGEGRWRTENFPETEVAHSALLWNGDTNESNYSELREQALANGLGTTWVTTYAEHDPFFGYGNWEDGNSTSGDIAYTYFSQIGDPDNNWQEVGSCMQTARSASDSNQVVVDTCDPVTAECTEPLAGEADARDYTCGELTDLSVALTGLHPRDAWVTRMEANLPRFALDKDLQLGAHPAQERVFNYITTPNAVNYECPAAPLSPGEKKPPRGNGTPLVLVGLGAMAALFAARRRLFVRRATAL